MMRARHRLYLADNLWLIAHDEYTGKGHVSDLAIGLALGGSLLGELMLHNRIALSPKHDVVAVNRAPVDETVAHTLLTQILTEQRRPQDVQVLQVRDWLNYLADIAYGWVVERLTETGLVTTTRVRKMLGLVTEQRHHVIDVNNAIMPAVHISTRLTARQPLSTPDIAFAGFALAAGLEKHLLLDTTDTERAYLQRLLEGLPTSLRSLIAETESAIGDAVLSHRI